MAGRRYIHPSFTDFLDLITKEGSKTSAQTCPEGKTHMFCGSAELQRVSSRERGEGVSWVGISILIDSVSPLSQLHTFALANAFADYQQPREADHDDPVEATARRSRSPDLINTNVEL